MLGHNRGKFARTSQISNLLQVGVVTDTSSYRVEMEVAAGVRQKVSTYAQRTAASIDQKLTEQERPRVERSLAWA